MTNHKPILHNIPLEIRSARVFSINEASNYYGWIISRIHPFIGKNVLDIGSGYGAHLPFILAHAEKVTSLDISPERVESLNDRYKEYAQFRAVCGNFDQTPQQAWMKVSGFDTAVCLDLLEHSADDLATLRHLNTILVAGEGVLILKIPAHPGLYGSLDKQAGHYRRYTKSEIATKLEQTGFKILHLEYFNRLGSVFWWLNGRVFKRRLNSRAVNSQVIIFDHLLIPVLKFLESLLPLPFGQSMLIVAVKQGEINWAY